jgi:predicted dehydrogenase
MTVRVALFGTKFMGKAHSQAYRSVNMFFPAAPKVETRVIVGRNTKQTAEAARQYGWQEAATDWKSVMHRDDIDLVDISTPGDQHLPMVLEAAKAKKHVVCEKPLGNTLAEAKRMSAAVKKAGVRHFLMHNYRRAPAVVLARKMVEDGRIGRIYHFRARYLQDWAMAPRLQLLWRFDKQKSGSGALGDLGSHIIDLAQYLCDDITEVSAAMDTFIKERPVSAGSRKKGSVTVDDAVVMCARFANGAIGTLEATRFAFGRKNHNTFEINGSKGSLVFDLENLNNLHYCSADDKPDAQGFREIIAVSKGKHPYADHWWADGHILGYEHTFIHSVNDFLMALQSGEAIHPDFEDGLKNQRVLHAVEKAARSRRWEKVGVP